MEKMPVYPVSRTSPATAIMFTQAKIMREEIYMLYSPSLQFVAGVGPENSVREEDQHDNQDSKREEVAIR